MSGDTSCQSATLVMNELFINKKVWNNFTDSEMNAYQLSVFDYYRATGFPYFSTDPDYRDREFHKLMRFDSTSVIRDGIIRQTMHGLGLAWSYMPHSWGVQCNDKTTPAQAFADDETFKKVIAKRIRIGDNISDNGIRKMLKMFTGVQSVSNFRPTAASAIYSHFCRPGDTVLDMSMGYGGRLLGAIKADVNYIGYDPCRETIQGLGGIVIDYGTKNRSYSLQETGSENIELSAGSVDFAFTSPPYFDTEKYSNEGTQSYIAYPTKTEWIDGFMASTFANTYHALKSGGYMAINIANVPNFKNLEDECVRVAKSVGFIPSTVLKLSLSKAPTKNKTGYKYEPVYIFRKYG